MSFLGELGPFGEELRAAPAAKGGQPYQKATVPHSGTVAPLPSEGDKSLARAGGHKLCHLRHLRVALDCQGDEGDSVCVQGEVVTLSPSRAFHDACPGNDHIHPVPKLTFSDVPLSFLSARCRARLSNPVASPLAITSPAIFGPSLSASRRKRAALRISGSVFPPSSLVRMSRAVSSR
jgi:hypothetical protein